MTDYNTTPRQQLIGEATDSYLIITSRDDRADVYYMETFQGTVSQWVARNWGKFVLINSESLTYEDYQVLVDFI